VNDSDPTKWVDEWPLPGLQPIDRIAIKSQLLKAHSSATQDTGTFHFQGPPKAMQQAYRGIAEVLWARGLVTDEILETILPLFVLEAAHAGAWSWLWRWLERDSEVDYEERTEIFPGFLGSALRWQSFKQRQEDERGVFDGEIAYWKSRLLDEQVANAQITVPAIPAAPTPKELAGAYFANFPDERILIRDLCWAAGQHYREWKRWLAGQAKSGATADLAFRRALGTMKRPGEIKSKPRPAGWE